MPPEPLLSLLWVVYAAVGHTSDLIVTESHAYYLYSCAQTATRTCVIALRHEVPDFVVVQGMPLLKPVQHVLAMKFMAQHVLPLDSVRLKTCVGHCRDVI